jgi:hypothetical protein
MVQRTQLVGGALHSTIRTLECAKELWTMRRTHTPQAAFVGKDG